MLAHWLVAGKGPGLLKGGTIPLVHITSPVDINPQNVYMAQSSSPSKSHITRRRQRRQAGKKSEIYYENCQGKNIYQLDSKYRDALLNTQTEADSSCLANCVTDPAGSNQDSSLSEIVAVTHSNRGQMRRRKLKKESSIETAFKEKLQKRVIGQIRTKIARTQALRACVTGQTSQLLKKGAEQPTIHKLNCRERKKALKDSINSRWADMRIHLALSSVNADQSATGRPYLSYPLSHEVSDFGSLPKLSDKEQEIAKQRWAESLSQVPLDSLSPSQFKQGFMAGNTKFLGKSLSSSDSYKLKKATWEMQKKSQAQYRQIIEDMPLLAYLKTGDTDNKQDMDQAFAKVEKNLDYLLTKVMAEDVDMGLLLSFKPLVEELMADSQGGYCLTAERAKAKADQETSQEQMGVVALGIIATVPCFMGGPASMALCLGTGLGMGALGYQQAKEGLDESLGKVFTGRDFEKIADLASADNALFWEKVLLPTAVRGTLLGTVKFGTQALGKAKSASKARRAKGAKKTNQPKPVALGAKHARSLDSSKDLKRYIKKHTKRLKSKYKGVLSPRTAEEQSVIMTAIAGWEMKGVPSTNISQRIQSAVRQCTVP